MVALHITRIVEIDRFRRDTGHATHIVTGLLVHRGGEGCSNIFNHTKFGIGTPLILLTFHGVDDHQFGGFANTGGAHLHHRSGHLVHRDGDRKQLRRAVVGSHLHSRDGDAGVTVASVSYLGTTIRSGERGITCNGLGIGQIIRSGHIITSRSGGSRSCSPYVAGTAAAISTIAVRVVVKGATAAVPAAAAAATGIVRSITSLSE